MFNIGNLSNNAPEIGDEQEEANDEGGRKKNWKKEGKGKV